MSLSSGKASGKTPRPPKDVMTALFFGEADFSPSAQNALANYIAELEAELAGHKARLAAINIYGDADIAAFKWQARAEKAEAEVERLRRIILSKQQLLEKLAGPDCGPDEVFEGGGRESGATEERAPLDDGESSGVRLSPSAAADPAAPSLSARKATRKTDSCDGTTHTVVHADGNVCPFLVPRSP